MTRFLAVLSVWMMCSALPVAQTAAVQFRAPVVFDAGPGGSAVAAIDVNRDHNPDLVTVIQEGATVVVRLGNGMGGFSAAMSFDTGPADGGRFDQAPLAAGDVNGDGRVDLVVGVANNGTNKLITLLGTGTATLFTRLASETALIDSSQPFPGWPSFPVRVPGQLALVDFDVDGHLDAALSDQANGHSDILRGHGDGTFEPPAYYGSPSTEKPFSSCSPLADVDHDGKPDVVTGTGGDGIQVWRNTWGGQFPFDAFYFYQSPNLSGFSCFGVGDVTGDGLVDVVGRANGAVAVFKGRPDRAFDALVFPKDGLPPPLRAVLLADLDGDGVPDLVGTNGGVTKNVTLVTGLPDRANIQTVQFSSAVHQLGDVRVADLNGDGRLDIAAPTAAGIEVLFQRGPFDSLAGQISSLQADVNAGDATIAGLEGQVEQLTGRVHTLEGANLALQDLLDTANETIAAREQTIRDHDATIAGHVTTISRLTGDLKTANDTIAGHVVTIGRLDGELQAANDTNAGHVATIGMLEGELSAANHTIADHVATIGKLDVELKTAHDTIADHVSTIGTLEGGLKIANNTIADHISTIGKLEGGLKVANDTIAGLQSDLAQQSSALAAANEAIQALTAQLTSAHLSITELQAGIASLQQMLQKTLGDPTFTIPGTTTEEQIQNLVTAINRLNHGQKQALYKNLGGKKK